MADQPGVGNEGRRVNHVQNFIRPYVVLRCLQFFPFLLIFLTRVNREPLFNKCITCGVS